MSGSIPPSSGSGPPTGTPSLPEQSQPVDLATNSKQPLRIPTVPRPALNPAPRSTGGVAILGGPTPIRGQQPGPRPLLAVPKATSSAQQVNLAVMNKVTVLTSTPPAKATPLTGTNVPRATATTIIRPPTSYPLTIKSPGTATPIGGVAGGATSIRLTSATPSQPSSVQLVPMSLPATIRPQAAPTVRPAGLSANTRGPTPFRPAPISDAVRVTLVQSPVPSKASPGSGGPATTSTTGFYKQVTITPPNPQKITGTAGAGQVSAGTMRIPASTSRMTVLPAAPLQTVSLAPTSQQINVPMAPGARAITAGKIISVPGGTGGPPPTTPQGVTIQKASIPVSNSPRTISLPYGAATQVAAISKPVSQAIPVARVCPQPNVVTITTTTGNLVPGSGNSVFIARTTSGGNTGQPVAINLSSNQTLNLSKPNMNPGTAKITVPAGQQARLVNLPVSATSAGAHSVQQQAVEDVNKMAASSPSRPSILRRREGERDNAMPETPPPRPDSRNDDAGSSSSGSTTLSATSSPGITDNRETGSTEDTNLQPSPRKKPRKQQLTSNVRAGSENWAGEEEEEPKRKIAGTPKTEAGTPSSPPKPAANYIRDKPHMSLLHSYRHTWKSRHNHFLKHSDVRPREEPRPTVNELANQKYIMQKVNGWKIYHLTSQMEDVIDMETELTTRLSNLQKKLDKNYLGESRDLSKVQELIKANLQRSKVIQDQVKESKDHALELFEHKSRVTDILHKYMSKRPVKKRDVKMLS